MNKRGISEVLFGTVVLVTVGTIFVILALSMSVLPEEDNYRDAIEDAKKTINEVNKVITQLDYSKLDKGQGQLNEASRISDTLVLLNKILRDLEEKEEREKGTARQKDPLSLIDKIFRKERINEKVVLTFTIKTLTNQLKEKICSPTAQKMLLESKEEAEASASRGSVELQELPLCATAGYA